MVEAWLEEELGAGTDWFRKASGAEIDALKAIGRVKE